MAKQIVVTVVGGTGLVGQGILAELVTLGAYELHSISRKGRTSESQVDQVTYHAYDLNQSGDWEGLLQRSDWVIDCVGILLANKSKGITYENASVLPAKQLITAIEQDSQTRFLFISANASPWFLKDYIDAKKRVEDYGQQKLQERFFALYPGLIFDKTRLSNYYPGLLLRFLTQYPIFKSLKKYRPISRQQFAREVSQVLQGHPSDFLKRIA